MTTPNKLLASIDSIRIIKDPEIITETYFVALAYDVTGASGGSFNPTDIDPNLKRLSPSDGNLSKFIHSVTSPVFKLRKKRRHEFMGGLPFYYGTPGDLSSVYLGVFESNKGARDAGARMAETMEKLPTDGVFAAIGALASEAVPQVALVQAAFSLVIKVVEASLLSAGDKLRYTNVFTFKPQNNWLVGEYPDVGNQRLSMEISVEAE